MKKAIVRRNGKRDYLVFDYETGDPILSSVAKSYCEAPLIEMGYTKENIIYDLENQIEICRPLQARKIAQQLFDYQIERQKELKTTMPSVEEFKASIQEIINTFHEKLFGKPNKDTHRDSS